MTDNADKPTSEEIDEAIDEAIGYAADEAAAVDAVVKALAKKYPPALSIRLKLGAEIRRRVALAWALKYDRH